LAIGGAFGQRSHVLIDLLCFAFHEVGDGLPQLRVRNPVVGPGRAGIEAPANFVFALCARFEPAQPVFDAVLDALVVAKLEMQRRISSTVPQ